ncbi:MAG: Sec-independent protein translocase protein TatB, partial [Brevundimonas sp.]
LGKMVAKARGMANEFRSSFDEMARQSELDELRKEVEALRSGQGMHALGADADAAFREIRNDLNKPLDPPMLSAPDEWPDSPPVMAPLEAPVAPVTPKPKPARKAPAKARAVSPAAPVASIKTASGKVKPIRAKKVDL